jgi:hypothetical protein
MLVDGILRSIRHYRNEEGVRKYLLPLPQDIEAKEQLLRDYLAHLTARPNPIQTLKQIEQLRKVAQLLAYYECYHQVITENRARLFDLEKRFNDTQPEVIAVANFLRAKSPKYLKFVAAGFASLQAGSVAQWLSIYFPGGHAHPLVGFLVSIAFFFMGEEILYQAYKHYFLDEVLGLEGFRNRTAWVVFVTLAFLGLDFLHAWGLLSVENSLQHGSGNWIGHLTLTLVFSMMIAMICFTEANTKFHSVGEYYRMRKNQGENNPLLELEKEIDRRKSLRAAVLNYRAIVSRLSNRLDSISDRLIGQLQKLTQLVGLRYPILLSDITHGRSYDRLSDGIND